MKIKPYSKNAKKHPNSQLEQVAKSIKEFGWQQPIVVDKNNVIIVGHGRWLAYKKYKDEYNLPEPTINVAELNEEQASAYRLADNKLNESDWDMELVIEELSDLSEELIELTGFDSDLLIKPEDKDDEVPDVSEEPTAKLGDIYQLGEHRIMCGDSTKVEDVEKLMDGRKADLGFNDPPYGMKKERQGVKNDNLNYNDLLEFNKKWIPLQFTFLKDNGSWYCWGIDEPLMDIYSEIIKPYIKDQKATFRNLITWDKGSGQGQLVEDFRMYPIADEKCLFVMMGVQGFDTNADNYFYGWEPIRLYLKDSLKKVGWSIEDSKIIAGHSPTSGCHWFDKSQWTMPTEKVYNSWKEKANNSAFKKEYSEIKKEYYSTRAYFDNLHDNQNNVWHFDRTSNKERVSTGEHATPKPIELCSRAIKSSCPEKGLVMDLFLGSGSTLIACEKTNRICYGMELDPKYIEVIVKRWEDYTGEKAINITEPQKKED